MKNTYLFAIEMDRIGNIITNEVFFLIKNDPSNSLNRSLESIKTHLGLLPIYISSSLPYDEDKILNQLNLDCDTITNVDKLHTDNTITYKEISIKIKELILSYRTEKEKSQENQHIETKESIANFKKKSSTYFEEKKQRELKEKSIIKPEKKTIAYKNFLTLEAQMGKEQQGLLKDHRGLIRGSGRK